MRENGVRTKGSRTQDTAGVEVGKIWGLEEVRIFSQEEAVWSLGGMVNPLGGGEGQSHRAEEELGTS